ncbi:MAG: hypothetical protein NTY08_17070, partial [Proteobacteria bacterium]|nr:hypothetical protein [Pseudomonadota bacterium]
APTAKLTVAGTTGVDGIAFPDGSLQIRAAKGTRYCGVTASSYDGLGVGGWTGAAAKCRAVAACSSTRAYMCDSRAINQHLQDGASPTPPNSGYAWVADTYWSYSGTGNQQVTACAGWTSNGSANPYNGAVWDAAYNSPSNFFPCNYSFKIMCCD